MKKKDINSVAYLFNEMDPSEEVEFNRELEENENLLIEVESFKAVQAKLGELPDISAPQHVLNAVYREAEKSGVKSPKFFKSYYYAVAAMVIVGLTAGSFMMDNSSDNSAGSADQAVTGFSQFSPSLDASGNPGNSNSERTAKITPWVDNNEVLRFGENQRVESASMDSVIRDSYNRLTPVTNPTQSNPYNRQLQLTGSRP